MIGGDEGFTDPNEMDSLKVESGVVIEVRTTNGVVWRMGYLVMNGTSNRKIVLASRPRGVPTLEDFRLESASLPIPAVGQILLRTVYLSLDPYCGDA